MRAWWWWVVGCAWWWGCAGALRCLRCGQYSDGVGSITPCTNASGAIPVDCSPEHTHCIKYVSELTVVRDCVPSCTERGEGISKRLLRVQ
ncbi:hypothetical protein EVAR_70359_1 [Eumeta japonica]|uniref:Secreted protein n=1 Tax=Eumeta variegata TaxID=151549 RepID=A0A4C2A094_EUMVA|nr:hypothetical protein EVAR_70359_1 [Eumeta japonica]